MRAPWRCTDARPGRPCSSDILEPQEVYAFVALATFYNKFYGQCSKAFVKLESLAELRPDQREAYAALAVSIFLQHAPVDTRTLKETREKKGGPAKAQDPLLEGLAGSSRDQVGGTLWLWLWLRVVVVFRWGGVGCIGKMSICQINERAIAASWSIRRLCWQHQLVNC